MTEQKKISLNMGMGILSLVITICISLFITPYIVNRLGGEAYGYVGLANNFVAYASLITIALNSMASRFVSIHLYEEKWEEASRYFTSVFFANACIAIVLLPVAIITVVFLEHIIQIPPHLLLDVKITFSIVFFQFLVSLLCSHFEIALFVKNKLYVSSTLSVISAGIRLGIIVLCFGFLGVHISYLVLGSCLGAFFVYACNIRFTRRLLPEMKIRWSYFDFQKIKTVVSSGVWNLLTKLSGILMDGLDLLIANLFIGPVEMGALAISKTVPAMFVSLRGTLSYPFDPTIVRNYAQNDIPAVVDTVRLSNKVGNVFLIAPLAVFALYGFEFFHLWVPGEDAQMIQTLSLLAILSLVASACINSVFSVFTTANKVKLPAVVTLVLGVLTTGTVFLLLNVTDLGVYVIAGVSSVFTLLKNYIFTPIYGAHCLGIPKTTFYKEILSGNLCLLVNLGIGAVFKQFLTVDTWLTWLGACIVTGIVLLLCNYVIVFNKAERKTILKTFLRKH